MFTILDIGSNSIRAMDVTEDGVFCEKKLTTTRLAAGLDTSGLLREANMRASADAIAAYAREARDKGSRVFAYATSAVRDARNRDAFLAMVRARCGVEIDVLDGEREAAYALRGAGTEGVLDIGGGSTQLVSEGFAQSWPIGCVRARELGTRAAIEARCASLFRFPRLRVNTWAGVGGTITTLCALELGLTAYDPRTLTGAQLSLAQVEALIDALGGMEERAAHPLLRQRHDVIIPGAIVCAFVMRGMGIPALSVSDADGMEGYFYNCISDGAALY